jgi:hypothetical protein
MNECVGTTHLVRGLLLLALSAGWPIKASDDGIACVKEIAVPSAYSAIFSYLPAKIEVRVKIGEGGKASAIDYDTDIKAIRSQLDSYFKEKTTYLSSCRGRTITFIVQYEILDPALDFAASEVRFEPPNHFSVRCHRLKPSLDPARPKDLERDNRDTIRKR